MCCFPLLKASPTSSHLSPLPGGRVGTVITGFSVRLLAPSCADFGSSHGTFLPSSPSLEVPQCADSWLSAVRARQTDSMAAGCCWKDATVASDASVAGRT